jgi:uncharacterized protein with FMN-binding domain
MKDWKKIKELKNFIPAIIVLALVIVSLEGHSPKTFATKVKEENYTSKESSKNNANSENNSTSKNSTSTNQANFNTTLSSSLNNLNSKPKKLSKVVENKNTTYKDGDFYGQAQGFRGNVKVCVTIKDSKIKSIKVVKSQDDKAYFDKATTLLSKIVTNQTTNVDTVSGATYSSNGLIGAVRNALDKATVKSRKTNSNKLVKNKKKTTNKKTTKGKIPYKDGVYYGTSEGYKGDVKVAVVIENQKIQYILIMENEDDKEYFTKAKGVLEDVLKYQRTDVDTVSGATYSSNGILEAIKKALENAKKQTEDGSKPNTNNKNDSTNNHPKETTTIKIPETGMNIYKDGTYAVTAVCNPDDDEEFEAYTLSAKVTIKNDWIIGLEDIKGIGSTYVKANDWYLNRAVNGTSKKEGIVKQILAKGNADSIDTVSGATCSSKSIIQIAKKALEDAKQ